ncbi:MAG TPA: hypothetical protein DEB56_14750 [Thiobacillus sp.]|nr:hypothetical protein [Thiobacillus sp.]
MLTSEQLDTIATRATQSDMLAMRSADLLSLVAMARAYLDQCERGSVSLALERLGEVAAERDAARAESATAARHLAASQSALSKAMGELTEARGEVERCREVMRKAKRRLESLTDAYDLMGEIVAALGGGE